MLTVNMHDAKTRLSELVARAVRGEPFIIAKAGKPMVKVVPIEEPPVKAPQRIGFAKGRWVIPDDETWKAMDREIEQDFEDSLSRDLGGETKSEPR